MLDVGGGALVFELCRAGGDVARVVFSLGVAWRRAIWERAAIALIVGARRVCRTLC